MITEYFGVERMILEEDICEEDKQRLREDSERLDVRIDLVTSHAEMVCEQLIEYTSASEIFFNDFLMSQRLGRFVEMSREECQFSQKYSPDIVFERLTWGTHFDDLPKVIPLGLELRIRRFKMKCGEYTGVFRDIASVLGGYAIEQDGLYNELAALTTLEMPFRQDRKNDSVILFVNDSNNDMLYKASVHLPSGDGDQSELPFMPPEMLCVPTTISRLKREAKVTGANLYFLENPSDKMRADWMVEYAIDELRREHLGLPPLARGMDLCGMSDSSRIVVSDNLGSHIPEYILVRSPEKYAMGIYEDEPGQDMLDELMEAPSSKRMH